ncbi:MAG: hypothetical protein AB1589_14340 [Cyanobacteriota bacterium]
MTKRRTVKSLTVVATITSACNERHIALPTYEKILGLARGIDKVSDRTHP